MKVDVIFESVGDRIAGHLYSPPAAALGTTIPGIVVAGPLGTVKEQAAGVFAEALAAEGFATLAFDYRRYGQSGGEPRQYEDPASKAAVSVGEGK